MIFYRPTDGDVLETPIAWRPRTAFLMAQLGGDPSPLLTTVRGEITRALKAKRFKLVDADTVTTGKDFLFNIWNLAISCPVGIAVVHEGISPQTFANIFYEMGWMQAYGKETVLIRVGDVRIPSDFLRTQYIPYDGHFTRRFSAFIKNLGARARFYKTVAEQVESNPMLAIDYLKRSYMLCGDKACRLRAQEIFDGAGLTGRARNSVESLAISF